MTIVIDGLELMSASIVWLQIVGQEQNSNLIQSQLSMDGAEYGGNPIATIGTLAQDTLMCKG